MAPRNASTEDELDDWRNEWLESPERTTYIASTVNGGEDEAIAKQACYHALARHYFGAAPIERSTRFVALSAAAWFRVVTTPLRRAWTENLTGGNSALFVLYLPGEVLAVAALYGQRQTQAFANRHNFRWQFIMCVGAVIAVIVDIASCFVHHGKSDVGEGIDFMDSFAIPIKGLSDLAKASVALWDFLADVFYFFDKGDRLRGVWRMLLGEGPDARMLWRVTPSQVKEWGQDNMLDSRAKFLRDRQVNAGVQTDDLGVDQSSQTTAAESNASTQTAVVTVDASTQTENQNVDAQTQTEDPDADEGNSDPSEPASGASSPFIEHPEEESADGDGQSENASSASSPFLEDPVD